MRSILRATAILGSGSIVTILVGIVSAKVWATLLGPSGLGFMGLLQSLVGLFVLIAGMGVGTGLVRSGAQALAQQDDRQLKALRQSAWLLVCVIGGGATVLLMLFRVPISEWMLGGPQYADSVVLMGLALLFTLAANIPISMLNAYHRVGALSKVAILSSLLGTGSSLLLIWLLRERGIALAIILNAAIGWLVATFYCRREATQTTFRATRLEVLDAARSLLRFGVPYTASLFVGTSIQFILPVLILHTLGAEGVGFYRAAMMISVTYLGFLLSAMSQDYYPRISAIREQPGTLVQIINQQHRVVMLLSMPMILGVLALAPYLVPLIYSQQFYPAVDLLEWHLIGDVFKLSSWTLGYAILARAGSLTYFLTELLWGVTYLATSWLGMRWMGLNGLGLGFLVTTVVYFLAVWFVLRRDISFAWTTQNIRTLVLATIAVFVIRIMPFIGLEYLRIPVALLLAIISGTYSLYAILMEAGGLKSVQAVMRSVLRKRTSVS